MNVLDSINTVQERIQNKNIIKPADRVLISISGGQDSVFLSFMLFVVQNQFDFGMDLIWCHHFWQESSFFTMMHLARFALAFGSRIEFFLACRPVTSEAKARDWRHTAIQRASLFYDYDLCAQGHTKSDRVETILFHLVRGAGLDGVSSLQWLCERSFDPYIKLYGTAMRMEKRSRDRGSQEIRQDSLSLEKGETQRRKQRRKTSHLISFHLSAHQKCVPDLNSLHQHHHQHQYHLRSVLGISSIPYRNPLHSSLESHKPLKREVLLNLRDNIRQARRESTSTTCCITGVKKQQDGEFLLLKWTRTKCANLR